MSRPLYESARTRHAPKTVITRGGPAVMMNGEPLCGAAVGPGKTTIVDCMVSCPDCVKLLSEGHGGSR